MRKLEIPEMLSIVQQLMVAGNEATTKGITEIMKLLVQHPAEWKRIQEDPSSIPAMVEEGLRLASPNQGLFRICTEDTEVAGVSIPKGAVLWVMFGSANRDERVFPDPDRFDPSRANLNESLAFGRGAHFCIGAPLARLEIRVLFEELAKRSNRSTSRPGRRSSTSPASSCADSRRSRSTSFEAEPDSGADTRERPVTETKTGTARSAGIDYAELLDADSHPVPDILRAESPLEPGPTLVPVERYFSQEFHDLEVEKVWKRVWQMACHEDDIPDVGDYLVYDIAELSFLIVRSGPDEFKAFYNACLHRGRLLREGAGKWARGAALPFHGWSWNLDGSLKEVPCEWDFPTLDRAERPARGPGRALGRIRLHQSGPGRGAAGRLSGRPLRPLRAAALRAALQAGARGEDPALQLEGRAGGVLRGLPRGRDPPDDPRRRRRRELEVRRLRQLLPRHHAERHTEPPHRRRRGPDPLPDARLYGKLRHPLTGAVYERESVGRVRVQATDGRIGLFTDDGVRVEGDLGEADPTLCDWIGGKQLPGTEGGPAAYGTPESPGREQRARRDGGTRREGACDRSSATASIASRTRS